MLERTRFESELAALGIAREHEASNGLTRSLLWYRDSFRVSPDVFTWLAKSKIYRTITKYLNKRYVSWNFNHKDIDTFGFTDGVVTKGKFKGKRILAVEWTNDGTRFVPRTSPDAKFDHDVIFLQPPGGKDEITENGRWMEIIAHEVGHLYRRLKHPSTATTPSARIQDAITDEVETRVTEAKILAEAKKAVKELRAFTPTTGSTERWAVERDFFPGKQKLTYLEAFVTSVRLNDALTKVTNEQVSDFDKLLERVKISIPSIKMVVSEPEFLHPDTKKKTKFQDDYPRIRLYQKIMDWRWRQVKDIETLDLYRAKELEFRRQKHCGAFFDGVATYTKVP